VNAALIGLGWECTSGGTLSTGDISAGEMRRRTFILSP
jgi:hypothetical protein